jgi:hypothetical protein
VNAYGFSLLSTGQFFEGLRVPLVSSSGLHLVFLRFVGGYLPLLDLGSLNADFFGSFAGEGKVSVTCRFWNF